MKKLIQSAVLIVALALASPAAEQKAKAYRRHTFGREAVVRASVGASVSHLRNTPHEWGQGRAGFAKRLGSGFGEHAVKNTIAYGVAGLRHEDLRYHRSGKRGFAPRMESALLATVVTRKTTTGKRTVASGRISGNIGAGLISRAWQPARLSTVSNGLASGGMLMGADAGSNVVQEFWPEIRHPRQHLHAKAHSQ